MKKIYTGAISAFTLLLISSPAYSQTDSDLVAFNPIQTGVTSLGIAPDARGGGMGDIGAATDPDVNSQFWNLAKYALPYALAGFPFSYTPWLRKPVSDINLA